MARGISTARLATLVSIVHAGNKRYSQTDQQKLILTLLSAHTLCQLVLSNAH